MNQHLRTALRFCVYIRSMGGDPIPFRHGSHREWSLDLQRQHERLRQAVTPELAKAAKTSARALIHQRGYRQAAEEAVPVQATAPEAGKPCGDLGCADDESAAVSDHAPAVLSARERQVLKGEEIVCRRKLRHPNHWSAILHVRQLGNDVRVYSCVCGGLHVGHSPDTLRTEQYRRARKRLRTIEKRLAALDNEWNGLICEKRELLHELGEYGRANAIVLGIAECLRRMLIALTTQIDSR